ncbi:hypothetical protein HDV00_009914 [Rhizophlyctis rosea]|nr:hypothetical protein HDV00_009914 [Rhizophlyctis rosea]
MSWLPANLQGSINTLASRAKEYAENVVSLADDGTMVAGGGAASGGGTTSRSRANSGGGNGAYNLNFGTSDPTNGYYANAKKNEDYMPVQFEQGHARGDPDSRVAELEAMNHNLRVELHTFQTAHAESLQMRDTHIQNLETRVIQLQQQLVPPPSFSPAPSAPSTTTSTPEPDRITLLQTKLAKAVQHLKHLTAENQGLRDKVGEKEKECDVLRGEVGELRGEVEALKVGSEGTPIPSPPRPVPQPHPHPGDEDVRREEVEGLMKELGFLKEYTAQLESSVQEGAGREDVWRREVESLKSRVGDGEEVERLRGEVEKWRGVAETKSDAETDRIPGLEDEVKQLTSQLHSRTEEITRLTSTIAEKDTLESGLRSEMLALQNSTKEERDSLTRKCGELVSDNERLVVALGEAKQAGEEHLRQLEGVRARSAELESEIDRLRAEISTKDAEFAELRKGADGGKEAVDGEVEQLRGVVDEKSAEVTRLNDDIAKLRIELDDLKTSRERLEDECVRLRLDSEADAGKLGALEEEVIGVRKEVDRLQGEKESAESEKAGFIEKVRSLEGEVENLRRNVWSLEDDEKQREEVEWRIEKVFEGVLRVMRGVWGGEGVGGGEGVEENGEGEVDERVRVEVGRIREVLREWERRVEEAERAVREAEQKVEETERRVREVGEKGGEGLREEVERVRREAEERLRQVTEGLYCSMTFCDFVLLLEYAFGTSRISSNKFPKIQPSRHPPDYETRLRTLTTELTTLTQTHTDSTTDLQLRCTALQEELSRITTERDTLLSSLATLKEKVSARLKEEMHTTQTLRSSNASLQSELDALKPQYEQFRSRVVELQAECTKARVELEREREEGVRKEGELERLRGHLVEANETANMEQLNLSETIGTFQSKIDSMEVEIARLEEELEEGRQSLLRAQEEKETHDEELQALRAEIVRVEEVVREREVAVENLQGVLESFQRAKEAEIEFAVDGLKRQVRSLENDVREWRERGERAEAKLAKMDKTAPQVVQLQQEVAEKNGVIGKLRHDVIQVQTHLAEAMRRMRDAAGSDENVDRRLITNLIVSFLAAPRGDAKRFEILNVIGSVLRFSEEEKWKVGLVRRPPGWGILGGGGGGGGGGGEGGGESFTDMWINYLLKESSKGPGAEDAPITPSPQSQKPPLPHTPSTSTLPPLSPVESTTSSTGRGRSGSLGFLDRWTGTGTPPPVAFMGSGGGGGEGGGGAGLGGGGGAGGRKEKDRVD